MSHLKCVRDKCGNAFCKRTYVSDSDVPSLTTDFEELSDEVKEFLSKVPNLYVEDAAVCSGRLRRRGPGDGLPSWVSCIIKAGSVLQ